MRLDNQHRDTELSGPRVAQESLERYQDASDDEADTMPGADVDAPLLPTRPSNDFDNLVTYHDGDAKGSWSSTLSVRVPPRLRRAWEGTKTWVKGPNPPRIYNITPIFPKIQYAPIALLDRYVAKKLHRFWLLILVYALWMLSFGLVQWKSSAAAEVPGYGAPVRLGCTNRYWSDKNFCGLNGDSCRPFANATLAFRCPADCRKALVLNPHAVGDQQLLYRPLVIGGPTDPSDPVGSAVYRGDSFICQAAIHSGFLGEREGGCGVVSLIGEQTSYPASNRHGVESMGFDTYFPLSFAFMPGTQGECRDLRLPALVVSVFFTALLSVFTTDSAVFFWSAFVALFFHVSLASDPPAITDFYSLLSLAAGRFLPAAFCAAVVYVFVAKRTLLGLVAQMEKSVLWLGAAWVGALNNYTFDRIPIQRLTKHDIAAQPGAIPALVSIVLAIFIIALGQAWAFRVEGRMPQYLLLYTIFVLGLVFLLAMPGEDLRIHHYILALLLLPGTSFQTRPSLVYQGLLVGLFINGIARWGFDSIIQTPGALRGDAQLGSSLPHITVAAIGRSNITFSLGPLPRLDARTGNTYDGISVLVNDVERFRGYGDDRSYWDSQSAADYAASTNGDQLLWTWTRHQPAGGEDLGDGEEGLVEYFRFGYMEGSRVGDFTKAGVWFGNGTWVDIRPGPSL